MFWETVGRKLALSISLCKIAQNSMQNSRGIEMRCEIGAKQTELARIRSECVIYTLLI